MPPAGSLLPLTLLTYYVLNVGVVAPLFNRTTSKIRSFGSLPNGWHFGVGRAPTNEMVSKALAWHDELLRLGFVVTDAFPGTNGEIMVTGYEGLHYVEILLETDATISLVHERDGAEVTRLDHAMPSRVSETIKDIAGAIWSTSGYFTRNISTASAMSSKAWPSGSMTTARPSSTSSALLDVVSATTSENIIPTSGANLQFFGYSTKPSFLKIPA